MKPTSKEPHRPSLTRSTCPAASKLETDGVKDMDKMRRVSALVKGANQ